MKNWTSLAFLMTVGWTQAQIDLGSYDFQREVMNPQEGWYRVELPLEMIGKMKPSFSDLRFYGLDAKGDTIRIPYQVETWRPGSELVSKSFNSFNEVRNEKGYSIVLELQEDTVYNQLELDINLQNFDWLVDVHASNDLKTWTPRVEDYRILAITRSSERYRSTRLRFSNTRSKFLRMSIKTVEDFELRSVSVMEEKKDEVRMAVRAGDQREYYSEEKNESIWEIGLNDRIPIAGLQFDTREGEDFYRPLILEYVVDSVMKKGKMQPVYRQAHNSWVSSRESEMVFPVTYAQNWRIRIQHRDNEPVQLDNIQLKAFNYTALVNIPSCERVFALYGKEYAAPPQFDRSGFKDKAQKELSSLQVNDEQILPKFEKEKKKALFESKWWLWLILIAISAFLGFFAIRMLRS